MHPQLFLVENLSNFLSHKCTNYKLQCNHHLMRYGRHKILLPAKTSIRISFIQNFFFSIGQFSRTTCAGTFPFVTNIVHLLFMFRKPATYRPTTRTCLRNPTTHSCSLFPGPSSRCGVYSSLRMYTIITTGNGASWWLISNSGPGLVW